jgi:hypothetical protein
MTIVSSEGTDMGRCDDQPAPLGASRHAHQFLRHRSLKV